MLRAFGFLFRLRSQQQAKERLFRESTHSVWSLPLRSSLHLVLDNPKNSSQILECPASHTRDSRADSESKKNLDSRFKITES
ncbi:hypothetical protein [uncultured Helicobacter sp.]|uniref:hypothetical protein n=1 Tax=uncultured Helicobacter sp. TaxID=175537 RepID=UPI00374E4274